MKLLQGPETEPLALFDSEDECILKLLNIGNYLPIDRE